MTTKIILQGQLFDYLEEIYKAQGAHTVKIPFGDPWSSEFSIQTWARGKYIDGPNRGVAWYLEDQRPWKR